MSEELPDIHEPPEGWTIASVRSVVDVLQYGISTKADADPGAGVPILRMGNIQDGHLDLSDLKYVPKVRGLDALRLARGDILFNRTNSPDLVGKSAVVDVDREMVFASYLIRLTARAGTIDPHYLCWWINSAWGREWAARVRTDGVSQSNINGTKLGEMPLPVAPPPEQRRIVMAVAALLEQVSRARERLDRVPLILKRFRQAVLAAAWSGELTPRLNADAWETRVLADVIEGFEAGRNLKSQGRAAGPGECGVLKISAVTWGSFRPEENKALLAGDEPRPHECAYRASRSLSSAHHDHVIRCIAIGAKRRFSWGLGGSLWCLVSVGARG